MTDWLIAIVLGLVEGATEFVPVSSTGHLIVFGHALGYTGEKADTFEVVIQLGAILAVACLYRHHLRALASVQHRPGFAGRRGWLLLGLTTAPALFLGAAFHAQITDRLFDPTTVALGWAAGGVVMIMVERWRPRTTVHDLHALNWRTASLIGVAQCCALWPGFSRAGATMAGAMALGVRRETAAEYSFLAAIPVIAAATLFDLATSLHVLGRQDIPTFALGLVVAFAAAWLAVRTFLRLLATTTLAPFGWYRLGAAVLVLLAIELGMLTT
jgi:undecaprenyl-diphosphatase